MPNHVSHHCIVTGPAEDVAAFRTLMFREEPVLYGLFHKDEAKRGQPTGEIETIFDFNAIIPMPEILKGSENSSDVSFGLFALGKEKLEAGPFRASPLTYPWVKKLGITTREQFVEWLKKDRPDAIHAAEKALKAHAETGHLDWYTWSIANWGTKWNAYHLGLGENDTPERCEFSFQTAWATPAPVFDALTKRFPALTFDLAAFDEGWNFFCLGIWGKDDFQVQDAPLDKMDPSLVTAHMRCYGEPPEKDEEEESSEG